MNSPAPVPLSPTTADSGTTSQAITRQSGSNLALSFFCLPPEKRQAMNSFYAFCRIIDDIADSPDFPIPEKKRRLAEWREEIHRAYLGTPLSPLGLELAEIIRRYLIPPTPLEEILNGVEMDLVQDRFRNFAELEQYCYRVASAVGLVSIEIFTYRQPQTREYAVALGMAFQLTNIIRDVRKDTENNRIYLPLDELAAWGLTEADVMHHRWSPRFRSFLKFQCHRARHYFAKSARLLHPKDRPDMLAAEIMREVYEGVLNKIEALDYNVFDYSARLNRPQKALAIFRAWRRERSSPTCPPRPKKVLVLGAGWAGIAAAVECVARGHQVTLLEGRNILGGRAHSFPDGDGKGALDNGQHILMGCYHETLGLIEHLDDTSRLLAPQNLSVPYSSNRGLSELSAAPLPAPLHLAVALFRFRELSFSDRWSATCLSLRLRFGQLPGPDETVAEWLKRSRQTPNVIRALWEPLCLAAMNEPLDRASAMLFSTVVKRALLATAADSRILISKVGLSDLFAPEAVSLITMCGGSVLAGKQIAGLTFDGTRCTGVEIQGGEKFTADQVISALPWTSLRTFLPPESPLVENLRNIPEAPIVSVHLWLDRSILDQPFVGFLDSPLHWVFSRDHIEDSSGTPSHHYTLIISAAGDWINTPTEEIKALALKELQRLWAPSRDAVPVRWFVYKSRGATFAASPATEKLRPGTATPWKNFWLAGDWTDTGLPATLEGAVVSGNRAAKLMDAAPS